MVVCISTSQWLYLYHHYNGFMYINITMVVSISLQWLYVYEHHYGCIYIIITMVVHPSEVQI
jgi:hypothetical protein